MVHKWPHSDSVPNAPHGTPNTSSFSRNNLRSSIPIPTGTVASRVQSIQSLSHSHSIQLLPRSSPQVRGGCHTDGSQALGPWKLPPNTGRNVKTSISHIGPKNPRKIHETAYTTQDPDPRVSRTHNGDRMVRKASAGRVDKLRRQGEHPVHDSVPKLRVIRRIEDTDRISQEQNNHCDYTDLHSKCLPVTTSKPQNSQSPQQPHRHESTRSESSITTTSTMRRLSVRELFQDYGVERPSGFASPTNSSDTMKERSRSKKAHVCCHVCSFTNRYVQLDCTKCGHHFCSNCPAYSTRIHHAPPYGYTKAAYKETSLGKIDMRAGLQHSISDLSKRKTARPDPTPIQRSRSKVEQLRNMSNPLSINTSLVSEVSARNMDSTRAQRHRPAYYEQATPHTSSKDVSAVANQTPSTLRQESSVPQKALRSRRRAGGAWDSLRAHQGSPGPPFERTDINFIDHSQDGPRSIQCDIQNSNGDYKNHSSGKAVPRSKVDQTPVRQSSRLSHPYFSRPHSRSSQNSRRPDLMPLRTPSSFTRAQHLRNSSNLQQVPELVECHGYPRTGHGQCGSPVEAGIVGECQHCVDDCECLACQSTPHNVRCCTHRDHPSIAHTHPISQTISRISRSLSSCSSEREEVIPVLPLSLSHQVEGAKQAYVDDRLSASDSDMSKRTVGLHQPEVTTVMKKRKPLFKYPVAPIDKMGSRSSESVALVAKRKNAITTTEGILSQNNDNNKRNPRQESFAQTLEHFPTPDIQVKTTHTLEDCPVSSEDTSQNQKSPFSNLFEKISRESLKLQANQKEKRREALGQVKRGANERNKERNVNKIELRSMKQLEILRKEEIIPYEEDKHPDHSALTALFLNYQIGRRSKRGNRPSSPLSPKNNRDAIRTLSDGSQTLQHKREAAFNTSVLAKSSDIEQARGRLDVENDGQRGRFKTTTKGTEVMGITVIVHMSNKEDLFFHVDTTTTANR